MDSLRLHLLGSPHITRQDEPITIQRRKTLALLAYLFVTAQPQNREALATLFWPDYDQAGARANLRRDLSRLREAVGDTPLVISRTEVRCNPDSPVWLDTAVFTSHLAAVRQHSHPPEHLCPECLNALTTAVTLYQGDFMTGFSLPDSPEFDRWQFFQAETLRQGLAEALQQLIQWHSGQGEFEPGLAYARRWLSLDALHEPAQRQLMQLYAWSGQSAAALRQYQECVHLLQTELGIPPAAETTALYEAIRTRQLTPPPGLIRQHVSIAAASPTERYQLQEKLAVGGHGELFRGLDRATGQVVVIKRIRPELISSNPEYMARFQREGQILSELNHPNIVTMLSHFELEGQHHIVMEYIPDGSLRHLLERQPQLPLTQALTIALELADALSRAHHRQIIHRDIKPENVLLASDGSPRLTDFGLARLRHDNSLITQTGLFIGSPAYMSPEALRGEPLDARADIWSFAILLYEMLAGRRPFTGEQITPVMVRILSEPVPDIRQFRSDVPPALAELLERMLDKEPEKRIGSMRLVAAALEAIRDLSPTITSSTYQGNIFTPGASHTPSPAPGQSRNHNLPPQATNFVGRTREVDVLCRWLLDVEDYRLLTLLGPGGMGKTRLALAAAQSVLNSFPDGVFFVPLAPLTTPEQIPLALTESLQLHLLSTEEPKQQILAYLRHKRMLLVLDNFEHLLEGAALVADILQTAPNVKILVTSRERLHLSNERIYTLEGLAYPEWQTLPEAWDEAELIAYDALNLLQQRLRIMQVALPLPASEWEAMIRVCHLVQGMPLALMLATSWLPLLSFNEIATEIEQCLDFLEGEIRDLPERQRSMRATFDSSWRRLKPAEQTVFMQLSVFRGGFTRQAAQAVTGASLRILRTLADKSLLTLVRRGRDGHNERCEIHELLRQYGAEALEKAGLTETARQHHSDYYFDLLQRRESDLKGRDQRGALQEIEADMENIRQAWHWALSHQDLTALSKAVEPLHFFYDMRGRQEEGSLFLHTSCRQLLAAGVPDTHPVLIRLLTRAHFLGLFAAANDHPEIESALQRGLTLTQQQGDLAEIAYCQGALGSYYNQVIFNREKALPLYQEALATYRTLGDPFFISRALQWQSLCYLRHGPISEFYRLARAGLEVARRCGNKIDIVYALINLSEMTLTQGDYETAAHDLQEAVQVAEEMEAHVPLVYLEMLHSFLACLEGDMTKAHILIERAYHRAVEISHTIILAFTAGLRTLLCGLAGEHDLARQMGEVSLSVSGNHGLGLIMAHWGLAVIACNEQHDEEARSHLYEALSEAHKNQLVAPLLWLLPVVALVVAAASQEEHARELLTLAYTHPLGKTGWCAHWPLLVSLQQKLQTEQNEATWQHDQSLTPEAITQQFLAAWGT